MFSPKTKFSQKHVFTIKHVFHQKRSFHQKTCFHQTRPDQTRNRGEIGKVGNRGKLEIIERVGKTCFH